MANSKLPEAWLRGPLPNLPALVQPVAHALIQAREEVNELMTGFTDDLLWQKLAGQASPGFHLQHMAGVLNRLFTYARGESLNEQQLAYLATEGEPASDLDSVPLLIQNFNLHVYLALIQLMDVQEEKLTEVRGVGRAQIPSTVIGLYTHAAEHTMRHLGQLLVTVKALKAGYQLL